MFAGRNWNSLSMLLLLLSVMALCAACAGGPPAAAPAEAEETVAGTTDEDLAPDFALEDLEGNTVSLADSQGQVRLLDFWATWCAPCREEIPMLNELHETYRSDGLLIVAISDVNEDASVVQPFVDDHGVLYPNLVGSEQVAMDYEVLGLPTAFLIDGDGRIVETFFGPKPRRILEKRIRELLELPPAA